MRNFLDQKGVRVVDNYYPEPPGENDVRGFENHNGTGPNPDAPRLCLTQTFGGKWNKAVLEMLTTGFILAVKTGKHKPVEHSWPQLQQEEVRKRLKTKLYDTQSKCKNRPKGPESDRLNRMRTRRQQVCLLLLDHCTILTSADVFQKEEDLRGKLQWVRGK